MSTQAIAMGKAKSVAVAFPWTQRLVQAITFCILLTMSMSLVVASGVNSPFVTPKALYARAMIDIAAGLWLVLLVADRRYRPRTSWVMAALGAYLVVGLASAVAGVDFSHSMWSDYNRMTGLWDLFHWGLFALLCASVLRGRRDWDVVLNGNLAVSLALSLLALARGYALPGFTQSGRVEATTGNPSYLAAILVVTTILAAGLLARSFVKEGDVEYAPAKAKTWAMRCFWAAVALLGVWVLFLTGTRGALAGLAAGGLVVAVLSLSAHRQLLKPIAFGVGVLLLAEAALVAVDAGGGLHPGAEDQTTFSRLLNTSSGETSVATRLALLKMSWQGFLDKPLLGWGHDNFANVFDRYAPPSFYQYDDADYYHAHNQLAETLTTKGILGLAAYLALWGALAWAILRQQGDARQRVLAYAVAGALAGYFVQDLFLFDTAVALPQWALLVGFVAWMEQSRRFGTVADAPLAGRRTQVGKSAPLATKGAMSGMAVALTATVVVVAVGALLYWSAYRPYRSATLFYQALASNASVQQRVALVQASYDAFPLQSELERQEFLLRMNSQWNAMSAADKQQAFTLALDQWRNHLGNAPTNARLLSATLPMLQIAAPKEALTELDPLVQRLQALAPDRAYTTWRAVQQELFKGNREQAMALVDGFVARTPQGAALMAPLRAGDF